jgi:hypothetical protein
VLSEPYVSASGNAPNDAILMPKNQKLAPKKTNTGLKFRSMVVYNYCTSLVQSIKELTNTGVIHNEARFLGA